MTLKSEVDQVFLAAVESGNIRYTVEPALALGTLLVSDGVVGAWAWAPYIQVVAAAVIPDPCWLCGISYHTGVVGTIEGDVAVAIGAALAEVDIAIFHIVSGIPTAVGVSVNAPALLPYPIRIVGTPRLAVRLAKSTGAGAEGCSVKVILAQAVGA